MAQKKTELSGNQVGLGSGSELVGRYEELRRQRFAPSRAGRGLTLLLEKGLVAWMQEWSRVRPAETRSPARVGPAAGATSGESLFDAMQHACRKDTTQVVSVLAELTMDRIATFFEGQDRDGSLDRGF